MGNVCSSGQKEGKDGMSQKSEESPSYQINEKKYLKNFSQNCEQDYSQGKLSSLEFRETDQVALNTNIENITPSDENKEEKSREKDSSLSTPQTTNAPLELSEVSSIPSYFSILQGEPISEKIIQKYKKIVIYIISDNNHCYINQKKIIHRLHKQLEAKCKINGFEFVISDLHDSFNSKQVLSTLLNTEKWVNRPLEAQGGHEESANHLAEINRHLRTSYIIPILFLGESLGRPLLPLTIKCEDFKSLLHLASKEETKLLEKWYTLDNNYKPTCRRLYRKEDSLSNTKDTSEVHILLLTLLKLFSDDLKDSYMTSVIEQEINNTVLTSAELSKRCIWIQTGSLPANTLDTSLPFKLEEFRRITKIYNELKKHLSEKNIIRLLSPMNILDAEIATLVKSLLKNVIDTIVEEHISKYDIPRSTFGIDIKLLHEVEYVRQYSSILAQNTTNFEIMDLIKRYIKSQSTVPLFVSSTPGCGKSVLVSKIMENIHSWEPNCHLILRYSKLTVPSSELTSLLGSIADQLSVLVKGEPCFTYHSIECYSKFIRSLLETSNLFVVIIIDSIDDIFGAQNFDWLPLTHNYNTKIILTVTVEEDCYASWALEQLKTLKIPEENILRLNNFSKNHWEDILTCGGGNVYSFSGVLQLPENWEKFSSKTPLKAKLLWWLAWLGEFIIEDISISEILNKILLIFESEFNLVHVETLFLLLAVSVWGIYESDCISIFLEHFELEINATFRIWSKFCWLMGPMLIHLNNIRIEDKTFRNAILKRYSKRVFEVNALLREYFAKQPNAILDPVSNTYIYNREKFSKLPYHALMAFKENTSNAITLRQFFHSRFFTEMKWISDKLVATCCVHLLNDIYVAESELNIISPPITHIAVLKDFLETYVKQLSYDGQQLITLLKSFLKSTLKKDVSLEHDEHIKTWNNYIANFKLPYLELVNDDLLLEDLHLKDNINGYDVLINLPGEGHFVASISTERQEICIWNVPTCSRVRILKGIPHPTAMCPVGTFQAAVLCQREIRVINLDEGSFKVTLKGVMNQKMPYFGLHDEKHLVCLSRNRMYVHLMNLESGDCVTTFKAGEDRFLNSLLVSGDGRILVCGDETQKPFPLLVWHLSQRKLLYDLRIPNHDFLTSLSSITQEGSYVCVVAKEINEPTPNFIVVYDLQSGTLFKKWKPSCNTVALAISQTNTCVIAGLEDANIIIWDLVTGNCLSTLIGHNAPVTLLKLDPLGEVLLSGNNAGRDMSIRLWKLNSGKSLAVYTPESHISTCAILPNGEYVVIALKNCPDLVTLVLRNMGDDSTDEKCVVYGNQENNCKTFILSEIDE